MINIQEKKDCCGCTACDSICPRKCISMIEDIEGFKFPKVDISSCINCGLCEKVCPMIHPNSGFSIINVISAKNKSEVVRSKSSSGGIFSLLAELIIEKGGVVVGCTMDEKQNITHKIAFTKQELIAFRSSKYVQSDLDDTFIKIRDLLRKGRLVLFSGTPCQVAGLRHFLIKPFENLICVDVLCHGVPSPKLFREYLQMLEMKNGSKVINLNFRDKEKSWKRLHMKVDFENGKKYYKFSGYDKYLSLFLNNKSQRNSCFHCPFASLHRQGDISLGDFWGIGKRYPDFDDDKGISLVLLNSIKGKNLYRQIENNVVSFESDIEQAIAGNKVLYQSIVGEEKRNQFYMDYSDYGLQIALKNHVYIDPWLKQQYYIFMRVILDLIRKIFKIGY